jgi:hypothetical protein
MIGTVKRSAAPMVPEEVRLSNPVHSRVIDMIATREIPIITRRIRGDIEIFAEVIEVVVVLMLHPLPQVQLALVQRF